MAEKELLEWQCPDCEFCVRATTQLGVDKLKAWHLEWHAKNMVIRHKYRKVEK